MGDDEHNVAYERNYDHPEAPTYVNTTWSDHLFQDTLIEILLDRMFSSRCAYK
jgi:hypothetical protein